LSALLFYIFGCPFAVGIGEKAIDPNLQEALLEQLGKRRGSLADKDWAQLERVKILGRSVKDLNGFQRAVNLRELNLRRNEISDLSPLSGLTRLELLIVADNGIKDISGLRGPVLRGLEHLDLSINRIDDLAAGLEKTRGADPPRYPLQLYRSAGFESQKTDQRSSGARRRGALRTDVLRAMLFRMNDAEFDILPPLC